MITSTDNPKLKTIRRLAESASARSRAQLFVAEGEDLVDAAEAAGWQPEFVLRAGADVDAALLAEASTLGSGTRVIGCYASRWAEPGGDVSIYLEGVRDPGNVGTIIRAAHALCDGPVVLGPGCADPFSPKALRASMGSLFGRPPARGHAPELAGTVVALDTSAPSTIADVGAEPPLTIALGAERDGLSPELVERADLMARIPMRDGGPESLNVAVATAIALYELAARGGATPPGTAGRSGESGA